MKTLELQFYRSLSSAKYALRNIKNGELDKKQLKIIKK